MWQFVNAVGFHIKNLFGSLEPNIITRRALAKTKNVRGGSWGGKGEGKGVQLPPLAGYAHVWLKQISASIYSRISSSYFDIVKSKKVALGYINKMMQYFVAH